MRKHNLKEIPPGFRPVMWAEVSENCEVYVQGNQNGLPHAYGPHLVADTENRQLNNITRKQTFSHVAETLLLKEGPLVVMTFNDGVFTGCYADVPLEVAIANHDMEGTPSRGLTVTRPRAFARIPHEHVDTLDTALPPDWPGFYGGWSIEKASKPKEVFNEDGDFEFSLTNRMAANALACQLMKAGKTFRVQPLPTPGGDKFVFTIAREVLHYIRQHLDELTGGISSVVD